MQKPVPHQPEITEMLFVENQRLLQIPDVGQGEDLAVLLLGKPEALPLLLELGAGGCVKNRHPPSAIEPTTLGYICNRP
jgi:hypothetical protein